MADMQSAGRGRMTRTWYSPPGVNLYFSLLLRPQVELAAVSSLPLVVGLAVAEALVACAPALLPKIKWPNDILIGDKKIAGILCELQTKGDKPDYVVVGVGININLTESQLPDDLKDRATSILIESGEQHAREQVLTAFLNRMEPLYDNWCAFGFKPLLPGISALDALLGRAIRIELAGIPLEGVASGILADGALLLQTKNGRVPAYSGEAHIL
jgi:BirA family biotin operon repressor/biotin-[acetyl-CoA-carboxylase] ligase